MPYEVSSTFNAQLKTKAADLAAAVDAVGAVLPKLHFLKRTLSPADYKAYINAVSEGKEATVQTEIITKTYQSASYIDPFTAYTIFDQVIYSPIEAMSPGWSENPYNTDNAQSETRDFYMRGVPLIDIFDSDGKLRPNLPNTFNINDLTSEPGYLDNAGLVSLKNVTTKYTLLQTQINTSNSTDLTTQKDLLLTLFGSAAMAKTYFVSAYLNGLVSGESNKLHHPFQMLLVDPYLAYLTMLFAWLGGVGYVGAKTAALDRIKGTTGDLNGKSLRDAIQGLNNGTSWQNISDGNRPLMAPLAIKMLQIFYEYINSAAIKENNKELYTNWMNMLVKDRKCMVNMLVIINERVNLNNGNTFTFQGKPLQYQLALAEAYKKFSMEIGE